MPTVQKSIRIQKETLKEIQLIAKEAGKEFSAVANDLLEEAVRMQRCPGIVFSEGTAGRRARIAGTGIEVWEIIATYKSLKNNMDRLRKAYHWLTKQQIGAGLGYYSCYPDEIDNLIKQNEGWTTKRILERYPFIAR